MSALRKKPAMRSYFIGIWNTIVSNLNCQAWQNKCQKGNPLPKTANGRGRIAGPLFVAPCNHAMGGITHSILAMDFVIKLQVIQIGYGSLPFQAWSWIQACGCWLHNACPLFIGIWGHGRHGIISSWLWQQVAWQFHIDPVATGIFSWNAIGGKHTLGVFCWIQLHYISIWVAENESFSHGAKNVVPVSIKWPWLGAQLKFSFHKEAIATKQHNH